MQNYKLTLAYDGSRYNGWQKQGNTGNTIQEKMETVVSAVCGQPTEVMASGRTDAGTHAAGQVIHFRAAWGSTAAELMAACNERLPEDIAVLAAEEADPRFHSRLSATGKQYAYHIWIAERPPVFERKYVFRCGAGLDVARMRQAAQAFVGTHDFKSFCANQRTKKSTTRTIFRIEFTETAEKLTLHFYGNGFLYQMVRILTGTLIEVGEGKRDPAEMAAILAAKTRAAAGFTAPSRGLFLQEVYYGTEKGGEWT